MSSQPLPTHLYHGTNGRWLKNILRRGLEPRGRSRARNNWKHVPHSSNSKCVYLCTGYAPYFAHNACDSERADEAAAIIEIALDRLDADNLYPDEDFLEQAGRGRDGLPGDMSQRTLAYRKRLFEFDRFFPTGSSDYPLWWQASLMGLGTCNHKGVIPVSAITRVVTYPRKSNVHLMLTWDPSITIMNQQIVGDRYRLLTAKLFAGEFTSTEELMALNSGPPAGADQAALQDWYRRRTETLPIINGWQVTSVNP